MFKLKKELKLSSLSDDVLKDEWVQRNLEIDNDFFANNGDLIYNAFEYKVKNTYYKFRSYLTYFPATKERLNLNHAKLVSNYLFGEIKNILIKDS